MDKIVVFKTFYNPMEADIVRARLEDSGVHCFLTDTNMITVNPLYTQALGGIKLHMFEKDVPLANSILEEEIEEIPLEEIEEAEFICPKCGSTNVGFVQATKKRFNIFTMLVSFILIIYPFHVKKVHHCFNCEHEF